MSRNVLETIYPLSPSQQGILFHTLSASQPGAYSKQLRITLRGNLNVAAFEHAWRYITARHAVLRTSFLWKRNDEPLQVVYAHVELPWRQWDWRKLPAAEQQKRLEVFLQADERDNFDLARAPLIRLALIQVSDDMYQLIWSFHHLILDGWSWPIVFKEVLLVYEAVCRGEEPQLAPSRPFRDYIDWLQHRNISDAETFWRQALKGFTMPTPLRKGSSPQRLANQEVDYRELQSRLSPELTAALQTWARQQRLTLNTLVQGSWALLLSRYSGEKDVVFGSVVSGRPPDLEGIEAMVGMFINTLPVRLRLSPEEKFLPWLEAFQVQMAELRQYEYSSLARIQEWSELERGLPLFESILAFENYPSTVSSLRQVSSLDISFTGGFEQTGYPLTLMILPGQCLSLRVMYDRQRFDDGTIQYMLEHLQQVLEELLAHPQQSLGQVSVLPPAERQRLLTQWHTVSAPLAEATIPTLFAAQAAQTPEAVALVCGETQLTYRQLQQRATALAHTLRQQGIGPEQVVGLYAGRSLDLVIGMLAILQAGGAYLPLDVASPPARLAQLLQQAGVSLLLTQSPLRDRLPQGPWQILCLDSDLSAAPAELDCPAQPEHLAYVMYTSGSTGLPKGVAVSHRAITRLVLNTNYVTISAGDRLAFASNISFDAATFEVWGALLNGATVVEVPPGLNLAAHAFAAFLQETGCQILFLTTALFNQLIQLAPDAFASLSYVLFGGEAVTPSLVRELLLHNAPEHLLHVYGPTENTTFSTWYPVQEVPTTAQTVPIGRSISNSEVYVLDEQLRLVPVGAPGELYVGGEGLARGYHRQPDLTAERFIPHPFSEEPGARLYRTGDQVRWREDGVLEFLGRMDQQVKIRGFRIEPAEIETILAESPSIQKCAVMVRKDKNGEKSLVAYIVPRPDQEIMPAKMRAYLKTRLPDYMLPSAWVVLDHLPLTDNGKVDRRALPEPEWTSLRHTTDYVAPDTSVEQKLADIWRQVLGVEQVGIHDDFFDLGGHSLLAMRIISQVRDTFHIEIPLKSLFVASTVSELALVIVQRQQEEAEPRPDTASSALGQERARQLLARLDLLSDEEVDTLLSNISGESRG